VLDPGGIVINGSIAVHEAVTTVGNRWLVAWEKHAHA
jgi:hypothetical protein